MLSEESLCLFQVLDWNFLRDQSGESVHDRSIADLIVILAVCTKPFVAIDLQDRLHEELGPYLIVISSPREDWLALVAARDPIINLYPSLFPHESELDPIFSSGWDYRKPIFLWVNSLPNGFWRVDISDSSVSNELELRCDPFCVFGHQKAHIQTSIDRNLYGLRLISWIRCWCTLGWRCLLLGSLIGSCSFLSCFFPPCDLCFSFKSFIKSNHFWLRTKIIFVYGLLGLPEQLKLSLLLLVQFLFLLCALGCQCHQWILACGFAQLELSLFLLTALLHLFLEHYLLDVLGRSHPNRCTLGEIMKAWWQVQFTNSIHGLRLSKLCPFLSVGVLFKSSFEIISFGFFVAWPLW